MGPNAGDSGVPVLDDQWLCLQGCLKTIHSIIHRMADEVVTVLTQIVCFSRTQEEVQVVGMILPGWLSTVLLPRQLGQRMTGTLELNVLAV